jgi:hypothetical protein
MMKSVDNYLDMRLSPDSADQITPGVSLTDKGRLARGGLFFTFHGVDQR